MHEDDIDDEQERKFQLEEHHDEPQHQTHHEVEVIDVESQTETSAQNIFLKKKDAHIRMLMDSLARARYIVTYLEQENKQLEDKQGLMELEMLKL